MCDSSMSGLLVSEVLSDPVFVPWKSRRELDSNLKLIIENEFRLKARREFLHKSATRIQAAWRGYITRKRQEKEIQHLRMRRVEEHLLHFVRRMELLETTVRRYERE